MAWQMSYTDKIGNVYPDSYWVLNLSLDGLKKIGEMKFTGFLNKSARQAGNQPCGQVSFHIGTDTYANYLGSNAIALAYAASATLISSGPFLTPGSQQTTTPFFQGAIHTDAVA
jgi:hypothetical protein